MSTPELPAQRHDHNTLPKIVRVALPVPMRRLFDYSLPDSLSTPPTIGGRVRVSFGHQTLVGIVESFTDQTDTPANKLKPISDVLDETPLLNAGLIALCQFASRYYHHPLGEVFLACLTKPLRTGERLETLQRSTRSGWQLSREGKGLLEGALKRAPKQQALHTYLLHHDFIARAALKSQGITAQTVKALEDKGLVETVERDDTSQDNPHAEPAILKAPPLPLNEEQKTAVESVAFHEFGCYLLEGVTGSGKTEVYLHLITTALTQGKQALVLIPEIGLSPQTVKRFAERFHTPIAELHSNVADKARTQHWLAARSGHAKIIIGTRLAVLTPFADLGVIIVDEEHDNSYKQQDGFRYSARDLAIYRAKQSATPIILGSATPSLESMKNAVSGRFKHLLMRNRAGNASMPILETIDLRQQTLDAGLSPTSLDAIRQTISAGKHVLVFVNRRGYAPVLLCHMCGWSARCNACSTSMTLHNHPRKLQCHHCGATSYPPQHCPSCASHNIVAQGLGTEQTEETLRGIFPTTPIYRIDRDSTQRKQAFKETLKSIEASEASILVGTQMLAKGHHIPNLQLVIIVDGDQGLLSADFRGSEQLGQLITQVSGRAGRTGQQGRVLIQTHHPDHPLLNSLLQRGYPHFAHQLLGERKSGNLPPYSTMAVLRAESKRPENAEAFLKYAKHVFENHIPARPTLYYLGPLAASIEKLNDRYRFVLQINGKERSEVQRLLKLTLEEIENNALSKRTRWGLDIDPVEVG